MGLFYKALQQATGEATGEETVATPTWTEADQVDLAGFRLQPGDELVTGPAGAAIEVAPHRAVRLRQSAWVNPGEADLLVRKREAEQTHIAREQTRILRTRVLEALRARERRAVLITSASAGEGKSMVAAALAQQISSLRELRVLLVDADLRRAGLTAGLDPAPEAGLAQYLLGERDLEPLLMDVDPYLTVLPTTPIQEQAPELLASVRMGELLRDMCARFDIVLLDGAPVGPVADSRILARLTGSSLLVVRAAESDTEHVRQAAALLRPTLLGSVLNGCEKLPQQHYGYGYGTPGEIAALPRPSTGAAEARR